MVVEDVKASLHEVPQNRLLGQPGADDLGQVVMGRLQLGQAAMLPDHDMAVAGAGIELEFVAVEGGADGIHENVRVGGGDLAGAVVQDGLPVVGLFLGDGGYVAAEDDVVRLHLHAYAEGLQGGTAGKVCQGVIAHDGQVGDFAAGGHSGGNILHHAHLAFGGQIVHGGGVGCFQGGLAAQGGDGLVGHAVAQNYDILHNLSP